MREYSVANSVDLDGVPHNAAFCPGSHLFTIVKALVAVTYSES